MPIRTPDPKPTIEQVAWVFDCLLESARVQGTYRYLIYDLMGFGNEAYEPLLADWNSTTAWLPIQAARGQPRDSTRPRACLTTARTTRTVGRMRA